jgi:hypothetical protein
MGRMPKMKLDDKGRPRRMPASYIMKKDERAKAAFDAVRKRRLTREEAETRIERVFEGCFRETLFFGVDRRMLAWIALEEGAEVGAIFTELETLQHWKFGDSVEPIEAFRRRHHEFVVAVPIYAQS